MATAESFLSLISRRALETGSFQLTAATFLEKENKTMKEKQFKVKNRIRAKVRERTGHQGGSA